MKIGQRALFLYEKVLKDHHQPVPVKTIDDLKLTPVSYEQRVTNENWTFDHKDRDRETGNEIAVNNRFVIDYLILERELSSYQGADVWRYVQNFVNSRKFTKILSIASGPCAVEVEIAKNFTASYQMDCMDINENLVRFATDRAKKEGLYLNPIVGDINRVYFDNEYDLIMCVAGLHHFIELEKILSNINRSLKSDGEFVTYEPICRSGMFLHRRQRILLGLIFLALPRRLRVNYQDYPGELRVDRFYHEYDRSGWTFECIRSGDIAGLLKLNFSTKHWGRGMTFLRRVSDSLYGPNYRLEEPRDRGIATTLMWIDRACRFFHLSPAEGLFFKKKLPTSTSCCDGNSVEEYRNEIEALPAARRIG